MFPLTGAGIDAHCDHALCAFLITSLDSCDVDSHTFAITFPVAGDTDSIHYIFDIYVKAPRYFIIFDFMTSETKKKIAKLLK